MALAKSLTQPFRKNLLLIGAGFRAYFSPFNAEVNNNVNNLTQAITPLDLQVQGPFNENALPVGWYDLGWITKFKMTPASKIGSVRSGYRGAVRAQYRGEVGETFEFTFRESTRMAWKIATGTEIFNLLANPAAVASAVGPLSSSGAAAVPLGASGYQVVSNVAGYATSPALFVPAGSGALFTAGQYIVADVDYTVGTYGQVGSAGIPIFQNAVTDIDFIRKTSDFVNAIIAIVPTAVAGQDALILGGPMVGGGNSAVGAVAYTYPPPTSKIQAIKGYVAREGGTYLTEWAALFTVTTQEGSQIALYYPHVSPQQFKDMAAWQIENIGTTDLTGYELDCVMLAMAYDDPIDGETIVRYACYYPAPGKSAIAI